MTFIGFKINPCSNYGNIILDFETPSKYEKKEEPKCRETSSYNWSNDSLFETPKKPKPKTKTKELQNVNRWPRSDHFWAITKHFCDLKNQRNLDAKNDKIEISGHYLAFRQHNGSNIGTQILKYNSSKITPLWRAEYLRKKYIQREYTWKRKIPDLLSGKKLPRFLIRDCDVIEDNFIYITVIKPEDFDQNDETILDARELLL